MALPPTTGAPLNLYIPAFDYGTNPGDETWDQPANANWTALNAFAETVVLFAPTASQTVVQPAATYFNFNFPLVYGTTPSIRFGVNAGAFDSAFTRTGAGAFTLDSNAAGNALGTLALASVNASVGYQVGGAAPTGHVLAGNGTDYVGMAVSTIAEYQTVQAAGVAKPQEKVLNFLAPFNATDNPGNTSTDIGLAASGVTAGSYTSANITVGADGRVTAASSGGTTKGQFTLPGGGLGAEGSTIYDTGIAVSGTSVVSASVVSGTFNNLLLYYVNVVGGTIKVYVGNTSSVSTGYGALTYNYAVL